jgi:uncharacterized protein YndB with AHSA1/START domain
MTHLEMTAHFDAPIERVFDLATEFERYPEWNVTYSEVTEVTGPPDKVGTRIHSVMQFLGRSMEGWGDIVEVDRPRLLKIAGEGEGGTLTTVHRLTAAETGTDYVLEVDYELPAGVFGQAAIKMFVDRAVERDLRGSIENFQALAEARVPVLA